MSQPLFLQNVIAFVWDFDNTLIPGNMQEPLFDKYDIVPREFWAEVAALSDYYLRNEEIQISRETAYLNHLLTYAASGRMPGLTNSVLRECGAEIEFFLGLPEFFVRVKERIEGDTSFRHHDIKVEHYIVSTGLRQMILGSSIAPFVDGVWGCEFIEHPAPPAFTRTGVQQEMRTVSSQTARRLQVAAAARAGISQIAYAIDNTTKTRAIFEINKGSNKEDIDVNALISHEDRRVPFQNMIYTADGPSDVPVYSILNQYGGRTFAVYRRGSNRAFAQVKRLQEQGRVRSFGEADYTEGSQTDLWLTETAKEVGWRIARDREAALKGRVLPPPAHVMEEDESAGANSQPRTETRLGAAS